jgi:hypothetical protein
MTAIALMICRFVFTGPSYHADDSEPRRTDEFAATPYAPTSQPAGKPRRYSREAH